MNAFLVYERIQSFKSSRGAMLDGVNYAHVVAPFLYNASILTLLKMSVFALFFSTRIVVKELSDNELLLYYSCRHKQRKDYDYIPQRLRKVLGAVCDYIESSEQFSLLQFFYTLNELPGAWRGAYHYSANCVQRLNCALLIAKYRSTAKRVFPPLLQGKRRVVTFCDAQAPENLLAQMANAQKIETFTNQHGQYRILEESNMSPDAEAYANFVSNYMLCWGEATQKDFIRVGFRPEQFVITGWIKYWGEVDANHPPLGIFGVMLNGENGKESNAALLEVAKSIAENFNMGYVVRLHPWSKPEQYRSLLDQRCVGIGHYELSSYLNAVDFSLAHMTGAVIEMLHSGSVVYLLDEGKLSEVFCVDGLSFKSVDILKCTIIKDLRFPAQARERMQEISKWFNDDRDQEARICAALLNDGRA